MKFRGAWILAMILGSAVSTTACGTADGDDSGMPADVAVEVADDPGTDATGDAGADTGSDAGRDLADPGSVDPGTDLPPPQDPGGSDTAIPDPGAADAAVDALTGCPAKPYEIERCGKCGTRSRDCAYGAWGEWSECTGELGACLPDDTRPCGADAPDAVQTCSATCKWSVCDCQGPETQECACRVGKGSQDRQCLDGTWSEWGACACVTFPAYADVSAGQGFNSGRFPSVGFDPVARKILVVAQNGAEGDHIALYRCDLDGTGCQFRSLSDGWYDGRMPVAIFDTDRKAIYIVTQSDAMKEWGGFGLRPQFYRCTMDGTNCSSHPVAVIDGSGYDPAIALDRATGRLLVATSDAKANYRPLLHVCEPGASFCSTYDISLGQGNDSGTTPTIAYDPINDKALVVTTNAANGGRPSLFRCDLDGTGCTHTDLSAGQGTWCGVSPSAVVDEVNQKLLVVTMNSGRQNMASLFRCNLDGTGCTHHDVAGGQPVGSGWTPSALVDAARGKLVIAMTNENNQASLVRCDLDGTGCVHTDISAGRPAMSGFNPTTVLLDGYDQVVVAATDNANDGKAALYFTER